MVVICYDGNIIDYDRRVPELSNVVLHVTQDANMIEKQQTLKL